MEGKTIVRTIISSLVILVLAGGVLYVGNAWFEKYLKQKAVQECMTIGTETYSYPEKNSSATTPNKEAYTFCMSEKGY